MPIYSMGYSLINSNLEFKIPRHLVDKFYESLSAVNIACDVPPQQACTSVCISFHSARGIYTLIRDHLEELDKSKIKVKNIIEK